MKYNNTELKEITKPQVFDPPKKMLVWLGYAGLADKPQEKIVSAIIKTKNGDIRIVTADLEYYNYCADIPEKPKPRMATNKELAKWCAKGNGQVLGTDISTIYKYSGSKDDCEVSLFFKVRKWEDIGWHEATVDYMGIE